MSNLSLFLARYHIIIVVSTTVLYTYETRGIVIHNTHDGVFFADNDVVAASSSLFFPGSVLAEMMKSQLDLAENFLQSQRTLYEEYCKNLTQIQPERRRQTSAKVLIDFS